MLMIVKRAQDRQKVAARMHLPVLAWPGVIVAIMTGRLGIGLRWGNDRSQGGRHMTRDGATP